MTRPFKSPIIRRAVPHSDLKGIHPILHRIYAGRCIESQNDLSLDLSCLLHFGSLSGIEAACARLHQAIIHDEKILIVGDFDTDGATSTALAVHALKAMGAQCVDYLVPNRFTDGYGLSPSIVLQARSKIPHLIVTVDNGISSHEGVLCAKKYHIDVIITDHHLPSSSLPLACAVVNPNQWGDLFPSKNLAGVGVIFYVMLALRDYLYKKKFFQNVYPPNMAHYLDLVALGTVADMVPLDQNNRILIHQGLCRIRSGNTRPGLSALLARSGRHASMIQASDLGFSVAPRLNAAGRLDDMSLGIACLLSTSTTEANHLAMRLDTLNQKRRALQTHMQEEARILVEALPTDIPTPGICLYQSHWHEGIIGLVATRIKDLSNRPVIAFAKTTDGTALKGSGRSVVGLHLRDILESIAHTQPNLILRFGGHAMAAGLMIRYEDYALFTEAFSNAVAKRLHPSLMNRFFETDGALDASDCSLETAHVLMNAGPWGQNFPHPTFDGLFHVLKSQWMRDLHLKLTLQMTNESFISEAVIFNANTRFSWVQEGMHTECVYQLGVNQFYSTPQLQLMLEHIQGADNV